MLLDSEYEKDGKLHSCWPEMWPLNRADKLARPDLANRISLEEIKERIGNAVYLAEYRGRPGESGENFFPPLIRENHGWWIEDPDPSFDTDPVTSDTKIAWGEKTGIKVMPIKDFLLNSLTFMAVDTSYTHGPDSDYKVAVVMAVNSDNCLFVLDMWAGQVPEDQLIRNVFRLADKWKVPSIHPEVVRESVNLYQQLETLVRQRATEITGTSHMPKIMPLKVGMVQKEAKISGLLFRFEHGLLKLPMWKRMDKPWRDLFDQLEQFNPEARDGGLAHDDHLDAVAMSSMILKFRLPKRGLGIEAVKSPLERLKDGERHDNGVSLLSMVDWNSLPSDDVLDILRPEEHTNDGETRV
jgi:predicted phage terminase large subunit-like protein